MTPRAPVRKSRLKARDVVAGFRRQGHIWLSRGMPAKAAPCFWEAARVCRDRLGPIAGFNQDQIDEWTRRLRRERRR